MISTFARHYKTGEPLPAQAMEALVKSKKMFTAIVSIVSLYMQNKIFIEKKEEI